jgi:diguanylate cyclase (GGDEF)-like protein/PAS domain S-box-containing protein
MRWESVFQAGTDAAFVVEGDRVAAANRAAGELFGCQPEDLVGLSLAELVAPGEASDEQLPKGFRGLTESVSVGEIRRVPLHGRRRDGGEFNAEFGLSLVPGKQQLVLVSVRQLATAEPLRAEWDQSLLDQVSVGLFRATLDGCLLQASEAVAQILGYENATAVQSLNLSELCIERATQYELLAKLQSGRPVSGELQVRRRDGTAVWVNIVSRVSRTGDGGTAVLEGVMLDISAQKRTQEELRTRGEHYRTLVHNFPEGAVVLFDSGLHLTVAESATLSEAGFPREALEGRSVAALLPTQTFALVEPNLRGALTGQDSVLEVPFRSRIYNVHVRPVTNAAGESVAGMAVVQDITTRKRLEDKLRYLSAHDPLTNLFNRLFFEEEMARLAKGRHFPVSVVVADVDGLKSVNDRLGHAVGDELLRQAAEVLRTSFRPGDVVARIGGDEFAVLLPGADVQAGESVLRRVRRSEDAYNAHDDRPAVHFSLGLATAEEGESLSETLRLADSRMYRDKLTRARKA